MDDTVDPIEPDELMRIVLDRLDMLEEAIERLEDTVSRLHPGELADWPRASGAEPSTNDLPAVPPAPNG